MEKATRNAGIAPHLIYLESGGVFGFYTAYMDTARFAKLILM